MHWIFQERTIEQRRYILSGRRNFTEGCSLFWKIVLWMAMPIPVFEQAFKHTWICAILPIARRVILHVGTEIWYSLGLPVYLCTHFLQVLKYWFYYKIALFCSSIITQWVHCSNFFEMMDFGGEILCVGSFYYLRFLFECTEGRVTSYLL